EGGRRGGWRSPRVGPPRWGGLKPWKTPAGKRSPPPPRPGNRRCKATSACEAPKPRSTLRPKLPCCPAGAGVKAARLKILPPGYCGPKSSSGTPGFTFGREARAMPAAKLIAPTMSTGGADLATTNVSTDHPPQVARANLFQSGEGRAYVTPALNE